MTILPLKFTKLIGEFLTPRKKEVITVPKVPTFTLMIRVDGQDSPLLTGTINEVTMRSLELSRGTKAWYKIS